MINISEIMVFSGRNIKRYFRDTGVILFSFLSVFIVVGLYMFFLKDMQVESIINVTGNLPGIEDMVVSWVVGGLLCIPAISVPLLIMCFRVDDFIDRKLDDLFVTSAKRSSILFGYLLSSWIVGFAMTLLTLTLCEGFIVINGGQLLSAIEIMKVIGIISLVIITFSGLSFAVVLLIKSKSAVTVVVSILNTLLGFMLGLFVPVGVLSPGIAAAIKVFPALQAASMLRNIFMKTALDKISSAAGLEATAAIKDTYGVDITIGGHLLETHDIIAILVILSVVFLSVCTLIVNRMKRK